MPAMIIHIPGQHTAVEENNGCPAIGPTEAFGYAACRPDGWAVEMERAGIKGTHPVFSQTENDRA
jgi:hypothetical protein